MKTQSPLRYPGGKSCLAPFIKEVIRSNDISECVYVEPFAGGAGIAINLLLDGTASKIVLNDADRSIYCFWKTVKENSDELCEEIEKIDISVEEWDRQKAIQKDKIRAGTFELGLSTLYLNRTNRSGVISGGIIGGRKQDGHYKINARFNKERVIESITAISKHADDIDLYCCDASMFLKEGLNDYDLQKTLVYADPPYYVKGSLLYMNHYKKDDHKEFAEALRTLEHKWLLSYDDTPEIKKIYQWTTPIEFDMNYIAHTRRVGKELLFSKDCLDIPADIIKI